MTVEDSREDRHYRAIIDQLVRSCRKGQCRIGSDRVLAGMWNESATDDLLPEQQEINLLLARVPKADRKIIARMIREAFEGGVHETLVILHALDSVLARTESRTARRRQSIHENIRRARLSKHQCASAGGCDGSLGGLCGSSLAARF